MKCLSMRYVLIVLSLLYPLLLSGQHASVIHYTANDGMPATEIHALDLSPEGELWLSFGLGRVYSFDGESFTRRFDSLSLNPTDITWDKQGVLWLRSYNRLVAFDGQNTFEWVSSRHISSPTD